MEFSVRTGGILALKVKLRSNPGHKVPRIFFTYLEVLAAGEHLVGIEDLAREEFRRGDNPVEAVERHKRL